MKTLANNKVSILITALLMLLSCNGIPQDDKTPSLTKTFILNEPGTLTAKSSGGGIKVTTHKQEKVIVQAFVRKNGRLLSPSDPKLNEVLEAFDIEIEKNGSHITANVERRVFNNPWKNVGISLSIIVPREMSCNVSSSGGGVKVSGVKGNHDISSSGGGVKIENLAGSTRAKSSGGGVSAYNQEGEVHLSSSGGGVSLDKAHGRVYAKSSGGGVDLKNVQGDVEATSSGGGVSVVGSAGYVKAKSSGGSVRVDISNLSKGLHLVSSGGGTKATLRKGRELGLELDLSSSKVNIDLNNFSGKVEKNRVNGTMNDGGIPVYMRASGGNIDVWFED